MPYHNAATTLDECLDSILAQTHADFEIVAVNDRSTDGSVELVTAYALRDRRIRCVDSQGEGLVAALNTGLAFCRSALVVRMDADDRMLPERLSAHLDHFSGDRSLDLSAVQVSMFPDAEVQAGYRAYLDWQNGVLTPTDVAAEIYVEAPFAHPAVAYKRELIMKLGGYTDGDFPEDYELWLRLHQAGAKMEKLPQVLLEWRESEGRLSRRDSRYSREAFDRLRARYLAEELKKKIAGRELAYWGAGRRTRRRADHLIDRDFPPSYWIDIDPRKIGNRIQGIPVVAPEALPAASSATELPLVLIYVANHGARELIAAQLQELGYRRGTDFLAVG